MNPQTAARSRWMDWQPKGGILAEGAENEPTKPSEPGSVGVEGGTSADSPEIEAETEQARSARRLLNRAGIRITGTAERNGRLLLTIARQSRTTIEGNGAQFGEAVAVSGAGSGQLAYDFDPASGEVLGATGNATLDFSLRSRLRTQIVRQTVEIRIGRS